MTIKIPLPDMQVNFATALARIRSLYLQDALAETVKSLSVPDIDRELAANVSPDSLTTLASHGLRGELVFPVPIILTANPCLLGYYRLLYGYSQKGFYASAAGLGRFKGMEEQGKIRRQIAAELPALSGALCEAGAHLVAGIGTGKISGALLNDLALLTLGPQLRGGANVRKGAAGILTVFNTIHEIVEKSVIAFINTRIEIQNTTGRAVLIAFAADPDIIIREEMRSGTYRKIVDIEVKAGSNFSNF